MLLITFILLIKQLLFIHFTEIQHNQVLVFVVSTSLTLLIMTLIYGSKLKSKKLLLGIHYTVYSLILFADVLYYSHFNTLPSISMLAQIKLLPSVSSSVTSLVNIKEALFIIDLPIVFYYLKYKMTEIESVIIPRKVRRLMPVAAFGALMISYSYIQAEGLNNSLIYQEPYNYHLYDMMLQLDHNSKFGGKDISLDKIEDLVHRREYREGAYTGLGRGKNLIVIQVEALQNFVVNLKYNGEEITPNLNKFIKDKSSIYYDNYYHLTARGNTSDAEFVSNNSLYPSETSPTYSEYEKNTFYGLPWILRENGYSTIALHGYNKEFWNRNDAYVNQGFETFISEEDYNVDEKILLGMRDEDFFLQSVEKLKHYSKISEKPFYGFMITLSSHDPFNIPEQYWSLDLEPELQETIVGNYLQSIRYFDYSFGLFLEKLKAEGLYENTVIALYGDHFAIGESVENDKLMENLIGKNYGPEDVMNIPLIIHIPGEDINYINSNIGSQLDFFPTILNIMGYENKKGIVLGRDLNNFKGYNFVAPQAIMEEGSFIDNEVILSVPKTRIFSDSVVLDIKTGEKLDLEDYKYRYEYISEEVNLGREILRQNLIKELMKKRSQIKRSLLKSLL